MTVKVYLGDLRHHYSGVLAIDCMPLGIAYMKAVIDRESSRSEVRSRLFVYPEKLLAAMKTEPPDVLMLSNYVWNEAITKFMLSAAKRINPRMLTVVGGPNISLEADRQREYIHNSPDLDIYVLGEGDFRAWNVIQQYIAAGLSLTRISDADLSSCIVRKASGTVVRTAGEVRRQAVDEIPSPWLTGVQDEFFDGRLAPMIETNRGCPFTCTFCVQGTDFYTKVRHFSIERIKEEIAYIARRNKTCSPTMGTLRIADSNYGMFERDTEISTFIGQMQRDYGWPTFIDATTGKNRADRVIKSLEQVNGALVLYQAVQSLDEDVLLKVKRDRIKLSAYKEIEIHVRGRGLRSVSDLIVGLPGESLDSHLQALRQTIDSNIDQLRNYQAMLLKGSEMETIKSRRMFKFDTRFRLLPKNFGSYDGTRIFETEEIVVATDTLSFDDYITARKWHLISSVFWNDSRFDAAVRFVRAFGIKNSEWWSCMLPAIESGPPALRDFLDGFIQETIGELFVSVDECAAFYSKSENFDKLTRGDIGDNLMYRYRAMFSFLLWDSFCDTAMNATLKLIRQHEVDQKIERFDEFFDDFRTFIRLRHCSGLSEEKLFHPKQATLRYNFACWLESDDLTNPNLYRLEQPALFDFRLTTESQNELKSALQVWTTDIKGLSKLVTRVTTRCQVRECIPVTIFKSAGTVDNNTKTLQRSS